MKDKINVAELLKDCPKGMELDCAMFENVTFVRVDMSRKQFPIEIAVSGSRSKYLTKEGCFHDTTLLPEAKCIIFPKGKTTWEEFQRPFKDGDILSYQFAGFKNRSIYIYRDHPTMNTSYYVALSGDLNFMISYKEGCALNGNNSTARLATEEEKTKLFQAIRENGYKWNPETKTLETLVEFKDGDVAVTNEGDIHLLRTKDSSYCAYRERWEGLPKFDKTITTSIRVERLATEEEKAKFFDVIKANGYKWNPETKTLEELPKFKVGDRIRHKNNKTIIKTIGYVYHNSYALYDGHLLLFTDQDMWELAPNKFEINTLKPFDKVLVRNHEKSEWQPNFFNTYCKEIKKFKLIGICTPSYVNNQHFVNYCIPYEGNEHLSGKTDDCAEYFKTWK